MKPLKEQILAADPSRSIWLTANAGTGKTFVLVNRLLRLIIEGNKPNRILCITYTKAAAAEMQGRIIEDISKLILLDDLGLKKELELRYEVKFDADQMIAARKRMAAILENPENLKIETIHAFCQSTLKSFSLEAGLPPFFNVIDENARQQMLEGAWEKIIAKGADDNLSYLLSLFSFKSVRELFSNLMNEREKLLTSIYSHNSPDEYISAIKTELGVIEEDTFALEEGFKNNIAEFLKKLASVLAQGKKTEQSLLEQLQIYQSSKNLDDLKLVLFTKDKEELRSYYVKALAKDHPVLSEQAVYFSNSFKELLDKKKSIQLYLITSAIIRIFVELNGYFSIMKTQCYALDYDDLIEKTRKLFSPNNPHSQWVLYKLEGGIDHILLDEAQDTNPAQWQVIEALTSEFFSGAGAKNNNKRSLFVVGDEKQSIYSFQGADINIFDSRKQHYTNLHESYSETSFMPLSLNRSFRSSKAVLEVVDKVLADEKISGAVSKNKEVIEHILSRDEAFGFFEISELVGEIIGNKNRKEQIEWHLPKEYETTEELKNIELLAEKVAAKVNEILSRNYALADKERMPNPGDIMILLRQRKELFSLIIKKLQERNIPVSGMDRLHLKDNLAVMDLIALGKFIMLENDDLNFASLLKSPIFELSEDDLFKICWQRGDKSVYQSLNEKAEFAQIKDKLKILMDLPKSAFEFYFNVIEVLGYRKSFIAYFGVQINEILDEFLAVIKNFELNDGNNLQQFLNWFEKNDTEIKRNLSGIQDQVRIMTVHGAKGLEAPIVILPDTTGTPDKSPKYGFTENYLFLCPVLKEYKDAHFKEVEKLTHKKDEEEYFRLLYVALTRARDELYIMGAKSRKTRPDNWHNIVLQAANSFGKMDNGRLTYTDKNYLENKPHEKALEDKPQKNIFNFGAYKENKVEVITPSALYKASSDDNKLKFNNTDFSYGLSVHKLLEVMAGREYSDELVKKVFKYYPELSEDKKSKAIKEVRAVLDNEKLAFLFGNNSKAEVPICGFVDEKFVSGKIDRLVENDNEVIIVDYKTNNISASRVQETLENFRPQLKAYSELLEKIYDKKIKAAILFTSLNELFYL